MCLAVPGRVLSVERSGANRAARVEFGGLVKEVSLDFVPAARPGDYVLVHVGFALAIVDAAEAARTFALLQELDALAAEGS